MADFDKVPSAVKSMKSKPTNEVSDRIPGATYETNGRL